MMRTKTIETERFHARTMHAKEFRISPPKAKIAGGEIDNNIYLVANDGAFLTDGQGLNLTMN